MENLTYQEKIAVLRVLTDIIMADNVVHANEAAYMAEVVRDFELTNNYKQEVENIVTLQALAVIRELSIEQKEYVAKLMGNMIVIDKDINYNEVKLYNAFCKSCNINWDFNIEDYPDVSLSGPFINPEDI